MKTSSRKLIDNVLHATEAYAYALGMGLSVDRHRLDELLAEQKKAVAALEKLIEDYEYRLGDWIAELWKP